MFKVTIETEHEKCVIEVPDELVFLQDALVLVEQALYGVGYRFNGNLAFVDEGTQVYDEHGNELK